MPPPRDRLDVHIPHLSEILSVLVEIRDQLSQRLEVVMADLSALQAEVSENGDVIASAVALLSGLSQQLRDALAANDPAALQALADELDANTTALADAVAANTTAPAEPEPPAEPPA